VEGCTHAVDRYLELTLRVISEAAPQPCNAMSWSWPLPPGRQPTGFASSERFVLIHPFSRGAGKSLSTKEVDELCQKLAPIRVVIAGRGGEQVTPADNVINLIDRTNLHELIWLLRFAAFVISVDSGPMHIASALGKPLVSIHTWSDPAKVGPYDPDAWVWQQSRMFQQRDRENPARHLEVPNISVLSDFILSKLPPCA
jgi:heptosyltransferase I